jgi:hypothetical protein
MHTPFIGRTAQLELLVKRASSLKDGYRQNIAVIGDETVGKSTILYHFLRKFYDVRVLTLYLEVRPESLSSFATRFMGVLLYNFLVNSNAPLQEDLAFLMREASRYIPRTVEKMGAIQDALRKRRTLNMFGELLSLCDSIHQESGKFCVVVFDEFHHLEAMDVRTMYMEWSKALITQKTTMYVIASSRKAKARAILAKNLSLLFGNFETMLIEPFDMRTCEEYLRVRLGRTDVTKGITDFITHFTGGNPFYLDLVTAALLQPHHHSLAEIIVDILFESTGILHQRFSNLVKRFSEAPQSQDYIAILQAVASGHTKIKDVAVLVRITQRELAAKIALLIEGDMLTRSGDFLTINDRVFGFWMRFVYKEKLRSLTFDAHTQRDVFLRHVESLIQDFLRHAQKPFSERISELLHLFEDEIILLDKKRIRLDRLREIKPISMCGKFLREGIIGRSQDTVWIVAYSRDPVTEDDVSEFARECKRFRNKQQRKIIVSLHEVDPNARLRAMEEKIWTWDLDKLNHMFDLYAKPRVIA